VKISYLELGIGSLQTCVDHLRAENDRELVAGVVLGHHAITCLMKATAQTYGATIEKGSSFSDVLGHLNKARIFVKGETKALELLNKVRNDIEHDEPDFIRDEFEVALTECLHIVERLSGQGLDIDLQKNLSNEAWAYLIEIAKYGDERRVRLTELLDAELGVYGRRRLEVDFEYIHCWECGQEGLLWRGEDEAVIKCKYCGAEVELKRCLVCESVIYPGEDTTWEGQVHQACFDRWGE